ncbi:tyrosine-protein phosphatase [Arthrobacter sp. GCM10027362]|uniref:tyrosine-protein phosphatase n=1 Tax=Arthrobacter sp. GCM10027362 TaxID=3273379 RepID=UPI00364433F6
MTDTDRGVPWEGAVNARLLAGDIYRMGRSEWLTAAGWQQAYDDGVRTIVDLRNDGERIRRPTDPVVPPEVLARFTVLHRPTEDPAHEQFGAVFGCYMAHPRSYLDCLRLFPDKIVEVFRALAGAEGAVVINCSAGRDRTGLVSMLLLQLAGATVQANADHYELGLRGINEWHRISPYPHPTERHLAGDELRERIADTRTAFIAALERLDAEAYLLAAGLASEDIRRLRARMAGPVRNG